MALENNNKILFACEKMENIKQCFELLKASLFYGNSVELDNWQSVFTEMKEQAVAALPGEWLKKYPIAPEWSKYCFLQQGQWIRVMHVQSQLLDLLETHNIPSVIIKGAAAAMYYPHPTLRSMGDVDILVKRCDQDRAAELLESNGYTLTHDKEHVGHHYNYSKDKISIELHKKLFVIDDNDEELLAMFENGIDHREWKTVESYGIPVLPPVFNGLVLIFHINQHIREGLGLRQIIDWMMYVRSLSSENYEELISLLRATGMEQLALVTTAMCKKYLGLDVFVPGCDNVDDKLCDNFMTYIMEKGNFGNKSFQKDRTAIFLLFSDNIGNFFKRLQFGGLSRWKVAKKYKLLKPFAWIYQLFRGTGILMKDKIGFNELMEQKKKGLEQRKLIEALGLSLEKTIRS